MCQLVDPIDGSAATVNSDRSTKPNKFGQLSSVVTIKPGLGIALAFSALRALSFGSSAELIDVPEEYLGKVQFN